MRLVVNRCAAKSAIIVSADIAFIVPFDNIIGTRYYIPMIKTFHDDAAESIWQGSFTRKLPNQIQAIARRKLRMLNNARTLDDLRIPPANRLEKLSGDREGQWSIRINDQWRICFVWCDGTAERVEICDYH